ncbi:hypothetical protein [Paenibacillus agilis]|uniref:Uncharacterized protein n=1 Tax=Paenibacillus agilis TaxID=3020863 RepID=A0A559J1P8_9BACL|nr:hypothetical protein [Paenibacillus agilis]TVX93799.1 hypothetical protein FPZ44_12485 [Paenibacillus agilis]
MNSNELKEWANNNDIKKQVVDCFWKCLENYMNEDPSEFEEYFKEYNSELIELVYYKLSMSIRNWDTFETDYNENCEFIEVIIKIQYNNKYIGYYKLLYNFGGEIFDDYLVWE